MKAVILAAGPGTRMRPLTEDKPKGLLQLNEESIVERQIRLLKEQGLEEDDIAIVIGYMAEEFEEEFSDTEIALIENQIWDETDNLYSFKLSRGFAEGEDFLVINGDAIFSEGLLESILEINSSGYPLDMENPDDESIKVEAEDQRMTEILGKEPEEYDGVTTEVFRVNAEDSELLFDTADSIAEEDKTQWFDSAVGEILDEAYFRAVDVSDEFWSEVDNPEELRVLREELKDLNL
jgi:choline kinase